MAGLWSLATFFFAEPRIDPVKLLNCLSQLLSPNGGIKSQAEVTRLANLMAKFSKKLVSKCIYIQILKSTDTELLCQFMGSGGWNLTHLWLQDAITTQNWPLVQEILELLLSCPVDVERLKSNTAPRLVKQLTKGSHAESVCILASKLVEQWLRIVRGETTPANSAVQSESETSQDAATTELNTKSNENATEISDEAQEEDTADENEVESESNDAEPIEEKSAKKSEKFILKITKKGKKMVVKSTPSTIESVNVPANVPESKQDEIDSVKVNKVADETKTELVMIDENNSEESNEEKSDAIEDVKREKSVKTEKKSKSSSSKSSSSKSTTSRSSSKDNKSSSSSSKHKSSSSKDKDKERDKDKHRSSSKTSSGKSSSSSSKSASGGKDKDKDKERHSKKREEELQSHKDAKTLAEIAPESLKKLGVIGKIPKKPREEGAADKDLKSKPTPVGPRVKPTFSIEERDPEKRSKTVKTFNSKFRSHGLEEAEPAPPPLKKNIVKKSSPPPSPHNTSSINNGSSVSLKRSSPTPPDKEPELSPSTKKIKLDESSPPAKPSKPKLHTLVETDMFSDALAASISRSSRDREAAKKRKRRPSESKDGKQPTTPTSPAPVITAPLKFYQDTLSEEGKEGAATNKDENKDIEAVAVKKQRSTEDMDIASAAAATASIDEEEVEEEPAVKKAPGIGTGPDGPPGILKITRSKGKKKTITWKTQDDLVQIRFFELDETERVNVTKTFTDMRAKDLESEKMNLLKARKLQNDDVMQEKTGWAVLYEVDNVPAHPLGSNSKERKIQTDRERTVLQALYFNRASVPDTPAEPDYEPTQPTDPKIIPLEDITGNPDSVNDLRLLPWPEPRGDAPKVDPHRHNVVTGFNSSDFTRQVPPPPSSIQPWANPPQSVLPPQISGSSFVDSIRLAALNIPQLQLPGTLPPQFVGNGPTFAAGGQLMMPGPMGGRPPPQLLGPQLGGGPLPLNNGPGPGLNDFTPQQPQPPSQPTRSGPPPPQAHDWVRGRFGGRGRWRDRDDRDDRRDRDRGNLCRNYQKYGNCKSAKCTYFHPR